MQTAEQKQATRERVRRYRERRNALPNVTNVTQNVTDVTDDVTLVTLGVTNAVTEPVTLDVMPSPLQRVIEQVAHINDGLADLKGRVTSLESDIKGISERLAGLLSSIESGEGARTLGGHRKREAAALDELPMSKHRQAEGRLRG